MQRFSQLGEEDDSEGNSNFMDDSFIPLVRIKIMLYANQLNEQRLSRKANFIELDFDDFINYGRDPYKFNSLNTEDLEKDQYQMIAVINPLDTERSMPPID